LSWLHCTWLHSSFCPNLIKFAKISLNFAQIKSALSTKSASTALLRLELKNVGVKGQGIRSAPRGGVLGVETPPLLEVKAMLLTADIVRELSRDNIHSGSNQ